MNPTVSKMVQEEVVLLASRVRDEEEDLLLEITPRTVHGILDLAKSKPNRRKTRSHHARRRQSTSVFIASLGLRRRRKKRKTVKLVTHQHSSSEDISSNDTGLTRNAFSHPSKERQLSALSNEHSCKSDKLCLVKDEHRKFSMIHTIPIRKSIELFDTQRSHTY